LRISSNVNSAAGNGAGQFIELDAILAVVIGGTALTGGRFSLAGTVIGALLIQTLTTTILTTGVPPETTMLVKALVVTAVCLLQSPSFRARISRRRQKPVPGTEPQVLPEQKKVPA
jgi:simple sugar transport system permease protein